MFFSSLFKKKKKLIRFKMIHKRKVIRDTKYCVNGINTITINFDEPGISFDFGNNTIKDINRE